jgi:hypothetical protein
VEIEDARAHLASCSALADEKARWPKDRSEIEREWARRSAACVRAADVGVRIRTSNTEEAIALLWPLSDALWKAEGNPGQMHDSVYETLIPALARSEVVGTARQVSVMARYLGSISNDGATKWMDAARSIALSPAADADPHEVFQLRQSIAYHYANQQRRGDRLAFLQEWLNAVERTSDADVAALEPLRMLMDAVVTEADPAEIKIAADTLRDTWLRRPQACDFLRDDEPDKRREAEIGLSLLRTYQVYALRTQQGRSVGPAMGDIVQRLSKCFGDGHALSLLAMRYQQDTTAGRPTNPY